jgi:hypothetical protein
VQRHAPARRSGQIAKDATLYNKPGAALAHHNAELDACTRESAFDAAPETSYALTASAAQAANSSLESPIRRPESEIPCRIQSAGISLSAGRRSAARHR